MSTLLFTKLIPNTFALLNARAAFVFEAKCVPKSKRNLLPLKTYLWPKCAQTHGHTDPHEVFPEGCTGQHQLERWLRKKKRVTCVRISEAKPHRASIWQQVSRPLFHGTRDTARLEVRSKLFVRKKPSQTINDQPLCRLECFLLTGLPWLLRLFSLFELPWCCFGFGTMISTCFFLEINFLLLNHEVCKKIAITHRTHGEIHRNCRPWVRVS